MRSSSSVGHNVDDAGFLLHAAGDRDIARAQHHRATRSNTFGQTMTLATALSSSMVMNTTPLAEPGRCRQVTRPEMRTRVSLAMPREGLVAQDAAAVEISAQELRRMRPQRQMEKAIVVDDFLAQRHGRKRDVGLSDRMPCSAAVTAFRGRRA